jgi:WD40 repeat protein
MTQETITPFTEVYQSGGKVIDQEYCGAFQVLITRTQLYIYKNYILHQKQAMAGLQKVIYFERNVCYLVSRTGVIKYDLGLNLEVKRYDIANVLLLKNGYLVAQEAVKYAETGQKKQKFTLFKLTDELKLIKELPFSVRDMVFTYDEQTIIFTTGCDFIIYDLKTEKYNKHKHSKEITCIAISEQDIMALGDITGKITLYYNLRNNTESRVLHWHAQGVRSMAFTADNYLLSGGSESTLVIWQLQSGHKQFIPRLSGEIQRIKINPTDSEYMISLRDNSVLFIDANDTNTRHKIDGFQACYLDENYSSRIGLIQDPKTGEIIMNGSPGKLQIITKKGTTVNQIDLSTRNVIVTDMKKTTLPEITHVSFCSEGKWMVTVEQKLEEINMKFWKFSEETQKYVLNTRIETPHKTRITALAYSPVENLCATTGNDGVFKLWSLTNDCNLF